MQALLQAIASMPLVSQAQRLFHGRGGLHPGSEHWQLDVFAPVFLLTRFGPASEAELECIGAALQGGAQQVVNVDMAQGAMAIGQHNHQLTGLQAGASFWVHDIFKSWGKIGRAGPYGLIIVDPPSYQKGSFVATKDYARLLRRLPELLQPEGQVLLCLNAPELDCDFLQQLVQAQAPGLVFAERLVNPVAFADAQPERALKVLRYRKAAG